MSQIIAAPLKIEFPEQLALSNALDGTRQHIAASEKAVGALKALITSQLYPIGSPIPWMSDELPSDDYFFLKGQAFDQVLNPLLAARYGTHLDDMRGLTITGKLDGEAVRAHLLGEGISHTHSGGVSSTNLGTKNTNTTGNHSHNIATGWGARTETVAGRGTSTKYAATQKTSSTGNHRHTVAIGSHGHALSINATGAAKNTVDRRLFNWIVRKG